MELIIEEKNESNFEPIINLNNEINENSAALLPQSGLEFIYAWKIHKFKFSYAKSTIIKKLALLEKFFVITILDE